MRKAVKKKETKNLIKTCYEIMKLRDWVEINKSPIVTAGIFLPSDIESIIKETINVTQQTLNTSKTAIVHMGDNTTLMERNISESFQTVAGIVPNSAVLLSAGKFGARLGQSVCSFKKGGVGNPAVYTNAASSGFALASTLCQVGQKVLPHYALEFQAASVALAQFGDAIENRTSFLNFIF